MVKGITKKMIMVKSPDSELFEQAFFVISDAAAGSSHEKIMAEACKVADDYIRQQKHLSGIKFSNMIAGIVGGAGMALIWMICEWLL